MAEFKELEERIQKFWEDNDVFRKSMRQREGGTPFVFYEGPPTANGNPGIHHVIARIFKDIFNRYQTMRGRYVLRKGGWDTHGLPVEIQVEKELGFKSKKDIEAYGIAPYNAKCRESVWKFKSEWDRFTRRIGYWVDLQDPYITYENPYIESLWNIIGRFWERKLLYQAHRVVPYCTRCGTPLSSHEVAQGYKTVTDTSVYLKFKVKSSKLKLDGKALPKNTFLLAWTTTPWTLPGNVALAVGSSVQYVLAKRGDEYFILAADLAQKVLGAPLEILAEFNGGELVATSYEPLFSVRALKKPTSYKVYDADFVTTTDGTGIVHTAVMYGEDDYRLGVAVGLPKVHTVDERGKFVGVSAELDGRYVKAAETEALILEQLAARSLLLAKVPYEHEYPFCWRCDTPLLYYAKDSWFVRMSSLNKELLANNADINWVPGHLKEGRFGQWLRESKDWNFSRERYWGTPLPIWVARDRQGQIVGEPLVVSSLEDLDTYRGDTPATFWVVRHGESVKNVKHVIDQGEGDSPLTDAGRAQALEAARMLKRELGKKRVKLAAIITSPIQRTAETAEVFANELGITKVISDERLREINLGPTLKGCHDAAYHQQYPTYESKFIQQPPGGESLADLRARMWGVMKELNDAYAGKHVLIVSHEYPIWMLVDAANGWTMKESIAEKERRGSDFVAYASPERVVMRNIPRDASGAVDLHRPYIDEIVLKRGGKTLRRVPEICDVWFDSGSMPYAQWHWPFEHEELFNQQFPADFISEAVDQTRGWFYTLLAVATALGRGTPFKNVVSLGHVLDEKGQKMSKSRGNVVLPNDVFDAVGVDATRWYFYTVNAPGDTKNFSVREVRERLTGFLGTLGNCLRFYELYQTEHATDEGAATNLLDEWILSRLHEVTRTVTERLDHYDTTVAARELERFVVDDFSQWWLRRSRKRSGALPVLRSVLRSLALLIAPFIPFTAEDLWQKLKRPGDAESVHLADWEQANIALVNETLHQQMEQVRTHISAGLAIRKDQQIKVRQPLRAVTIPGTQLPSDLEALIRDELNVKEVNYMPGAPVSLDTTIGTELRAEGFAREVMRAIQDMRKEAGCRVGDRVQCFWTSEDAEISRALLAYADMIAEETGLSIFTNQRDGVALKLEKSADLAPGKSLWIGIRV
ncbi:MAG: class I tRNA ligase family protein [Candidatus Yanofskybacteria bacterium]|nr:class I tRNA ligase family protein [Candidatus Yanofskybacteria bacterium]